MSRRASLRLSVEPNRGGSHVVQPHHQHHRPRPGGRASRRRARRHQRRAAERPRSEEQTSELQSLMSISYVVFCLKKKKNVVTKCHIVYLPLHQKTTDNTLITH